MINKKSSEEILEPKPYYEDYFQKSLKPRIKYMYNYNNVSVVWRNSLNNPRSFFQFELEGWQAGTIKKNDGCGDNLLM